MSERAWTKKIELGDGVSAVLTISASGQFIGEWEGDVSKLRGRKDLLKKYRLGRDALIADFVRETGVSVLIIEA